MSTPEHPEKTYKISGSTTLNDEVKGKDIVCVVKSASDAYILLYARPSSSPEELPSLQGTPIDHVEEHVELVEKYSYTGILNPPPDDIEDSRPAISVLISTGSGAQQASAGYTQLLKPLFEHLHIPHSQIQVHTTTSAASIAQFTRSTILPQAQSGRKQLILLLSGDGGMVDLVDTLYSSLMHEKPSPRFVKSTIALLPFGTGNALANSSGIVSDRTRGLASLMRGSAKPIPAFKVTLPEGSYAVDGEGKRVADSDQSHTVESTNEKVVYGAVVFSWAFHSTLVAESDTLDYRKHGSKRFQMAAKELLFPADGSPCHEFRGRLSYRTSGDFGSWIDVSRESHAYVLLTLVSHLEAGFCISPDSGSLDGKMRLVHFGMTDSGGQGVMKVMEKAYGGGKHVGDAEVGYEQVDGLRLEVHEEEDKWRKVCIDGKIFTVPQGGVVEVVRETRELIELLIL